MKDATHLVKRGSVYYFRSRVPVSVKAAYGKPFVVVSLHTKDRAEAKARAFELSAELEREYRQLRAKADAKIAPGRRRYLSDADIQHICTYHVARVLAADEDERIAGLSKDAAELADDLYGGWSKALAPALARGDTSITRPALDRALAELGITVDTDSRSFRQLEYAFLKAEVEAYAGVMRRQRGEVVATPPKPAARLSIGEVVDYWAKQTSPRPTTEADFRHVFRRFRERFPALAAGDVTKRHVVEYRDHLASLGSAPKTVARHLNHLHAAFQIAADSDLVPFNPVAGVRPTQSKDRRAKPRLPFTTEDLNKVFFGPVHVSGTRPRAGGGEAAYWLPLLALWTGARLEELALLRPCDVREETGLGHYLDINEEEGKRVKNASSVRRVPLHPELIELGFLQHVRDIRRRKADYLFPDLRPDVKGKRSGNFSKWFARYLDSVGVVDKRRVFHSFRHGFVDACREVMNPELRDNLVGHSNKATAEQYDTGRYPLAPLFHAVASVRYKGLSLDHMKRKQR
ncbi:MAG: site-specific integrase [Burkholderiales bacterium]|nr:site-specific integrase [Burkholderiales bacterium]